MLTLWECNNLSCDHRHIGEFFGKTHLPDTDCPKCGWHDSMIENVSHTYIETKKQQES